MNKPRTFLHAGSIGDVWASLPAIREHYRKYNRKAVLYLQKDIEAWYYDGATHPTKNAEGKEVMLNEQIINMMIPLLKAQPFIEDALIHNGEMVDVDLNMIRATNVGMPAFCISRWYFYVFPDLACDLTDSWLTVPDTKKDFAGGKILINRTERYHNPNINYEFLKKYEDDCLFVGTMREYNNFCIENSLEIPKLHVNNFLEYAQAIKQSRFYLSNQSQGFQLAQGMKHPRILELCHFAPNVIVIGKDAYDFFAQLALESYVDELYKKASMKEAKNDDVLIN